MKESKRLVRIDDTRAMELTTYEPDSVVEPAYPAFDTPQPSEAERIAALEARVAALEAALVEKLTVKVYTETPDYLKPPFKVT